MYNFGKFLTERGSETFSLNKHDVPTTVLDLGNKHKKLKTTKYSNCKTNYSIKQRHVKQVPLIKDKYNIDSKQKLHLCTVSK